MFTLPNILTCCNLVCGCMATGAAFYGNYQYAVLMIVLGAVFDFFDGMVARALGISSPIGKELDSLADVVTFGVAPSAIIFYLFHEVHYPELLASAELSIFNFQLSIPKHARQCSLLGKPRAGRTRIPRLAEVQRRLPLPLHAPLLHAAGERSTHAGLEIQELELGGQQAALRLPHRLPAHPGPRPHRPALYYIMVYSRFDSLPEACKKLIRASA